MDWNGKKVLVTGAGGFIGSHLVERLVRAGAQVRAFTRYNSRNDLGMLHWIQPDMFSKLEVLRGDLRDMETVYGAVRGVDTVFHLGALISIPYSYEHPREVIETNTMGTLNVLLAAREFNTRRVIQTSTSEVYGSAKYVPIDEAHPLQGQSPYSASKIGADKIAESFYRSYDLPVVILRPFNTYGPRQSGRAVIPTIIFQTLTQKEIRLGSLDPARDFTFVSDTIEGFIRAAVVESVLGQEINVGNNAMITVGELANKIFSQLGKSPKIVMETKRVRPTKSEVMRLHASNQRAHELLGWVPSVSLEEGLRITCDWVTAHLDLYSPKNYTI